jgi:DNA-binding CsgD family transcriptional regulator
MRESRRSPPDSDPPDLIALETSDGDLAVLSFALSGPGSTESTALTPSESHVVELLLEGRTNAEIAAIRATTPRTVANQVASLFRKLGVRSRLELVTAAPLVRAALLAGTARRRP